MAASTEPRHGGEQLVAIAALLQAFLIYRSWIMQRTQAKDKAGTRSAKSIYY
jgi:hypothetical protein